MTNVARISKLWTGRKAIGGAGSRATLPQDMADHDLLALYAAGDAQILTQRLTPGAYGVALRMMGSRAEAEELAQDAMLKLWTIAPDWQQGSAKVSTWLYRVTMNLCLDALRRRRGAMAPLDAVPDPVDDAKSVPDQLQDRARLDALQAALDTLPDRQKQAVILRHIQELPNPEIAAIMGIGVEAVESLTARGKRTLAAKLIARRAELGYQDD